MPDNLSPEQRSYCMSRVRNKDTDIERLVRSELHKRGFRFRKNVRKLPGAPDIVFTKVKLAVFIDGDFWHGYNFEEWANTVSEFWQNKISTNIHRDQTNTQKLVDAGWTVLRFWQHEIKTNWQDIVDKIITAIIQCQASL